VSLEIAPRAAEGRATWILIPLLVLHLALISLQVEDPGGTSLFRKCVLSAGAPLLSASAAVSRGAKHFWSGYIWLIGARAENERLRAAVRDLTLREQALGQMREQNARLARLLDFKEGAEIHTIGARVIGRVPDFLSSVVYIDRGSQDGVAVDAAVLAGAGVVGRAVVVSLRQTQVQLISNADASIGVMLAASRSPGVLRGSGGLTLRLDYINNTEQVSVGDVVVSSGLDGIFPKGIPVGRVTSVRRGKTVFRDIEVEPFADLLRLDEVLVVLGNEPEAANR